jgi:hypothetical protein
MSVYLGVDFHARTQTVCWCDQADGIVHQRTLDHQHDDVRAFYTQFAVPGGWSRLLLLFFSCRLRVLSARGGKGASRLESRCARPY